MSLRRIAIGCVVCAVLASFARLGAAEGPYRLLKEIHVGGQGAWDYLTIDSAAKRLYVSHGTEVVVVDTGSDAIVGTIADTPGVHGAVSTLSGRIVTSNGRENKASIVDAKTLQTLTKVDTERGPDFIMFEPK